MTRRTSISVLVMAGCAIAALGFAVAHLIPEAAPPPTATPGSASYCVVGAWNLEHFQEGAARGFPENTHGGPSYPARTDEDYAIIAGMIRRIEARILVLEEVGAQTSEAGGRTTTRSRELDRLLRALQPEHFEYVVGASGSSEHVAILYDTSRAQLDNVCECDFPRDLKVDGKTVFDREPLLAHFTLLNDGHPANDLLVVGVHLASGQRLNKNHDEAMRLLREDLQARRREGRCIPRDENDVIIAGDFNTSRFDKSVESFWNEMDQGDWDVLGDDPANYPVTRLSGVPLQLRDSRIDYIIVSRGHHGLAGEEVLQESPTVHQELIGASPDEYRRRASDHLPITVQVQLMADTDG